MSQSSHLLDQRIAHIRKNVTMRSVLEHFDHPYRVHGNMICCWHPETNPSARLYDEQNTYWCWVCSPNHGVDVIEFVVIELGLEAEVDPDGTLREKLLRRDDFNPKKVTQTIRSLAVIKGIEYIEAHFEGAEFLASPWEERLNASLRPLRTAFDPFRYWSHRHVILLQQLGSISDPAKWTIYSHTIENLLPHRGADVYYLKRQFDWAQQRLATLGYQDPVTTPST